MDLRDIQDLYQRHVMTKEQVERALGIQTLKPNERAVVIPVPAREQDKAKAERIIETFKALHEGGISRVYAIALAERIVLGDTCK